MLNGEDIIQDECTRAESMKTKNIAPKPIEKMMK